jgi:hypothetical protein
MKDFDTSHLKDEARKVAEIVLEHMRRTLDAEPYGGGCKAFYSPEEWIERGEKYGRNSVLILCHDGGDLAPFVNYDYGCYKLIDGLSSVLEDAGYYAEQCTCWYTAVYHV